MSASVPSTMRASVLLAAEKIELQERPVPVPAPDEVLVQVTAVGVCGSDVHFFKDGRLGDWVAEEPLVLGHEAGGTIVAVGSEVNPARVGKRVSIEPQHPSTTSRETLRGAYNLDPGMRFYAIPRTGGIPGTDGAFQEYVTIQSHFAYAVSDAVSDDAAGLMEPLSVAVATAQKAGFTAGSRVLIAGGGAIGVVTAQVAAAHGASEIIVSDVSAERRDRVLSFGATRVIDPITEDVADLGLEVDAFVDACGVASAVASGFRAVRPGGSVVLVGMGPAEVPLPIAVIQSHELLVTGLFRYANTWPAAIGLVESGKVDLDRMVTGHYGLGQVAEALGSTSLPGVLKSVVVPTR